MKIILKFIPIETIISYLVEYLISTVKNPNSKEARRLYFVLQKVEAAIAEYFEKVPAPSN